jgi:adenylate cyclase, class 2
MSIEIEKKYRLGDEDVSRIEDALAAAAAPFEGERFEENTIYGGGLLDSARAILRIRRIGDRGILTYKRRIEDDSTFKRQVEHESEFADVEGLRAIISSLGFDPRVVYEKRRKTWRLNGAEVVLDELPFGRFVEIEGTEASILEVEQLLGLDEAAVEHETYPNLTVKAGIRSGARFESRFTSAG